MNKKIIIILFALIIVLSFAAGTVLLLTRNSGEEAQEELVPTKSTAKILDQPIVSAVPSFDSTAIWYFDRLGKLFRVNPDGTGLSEFTLPPWPPNGDLAGVKWPARGNDFIAWASSVTGTTKHYFDNASAQYTTWPANIQSFDWMPDGRRVVYIWQAGDKLSQQLVMANADTSGFRIVAEVFWPDLKVYASPNGLEALLVRAKPEGDTNKIYKADLNSGEFEIVIGEKKNLGALWLPNGQKFLFTQESDGQLAKVLLYDFTTRLQTDLNLKTNFEKVALDSTGNTLFAAVPKANLAGEMFVKVDLTTFQQEVIYDPDKPITAKNLFFANGNLYYINSADNKLYFITE
ncbi:MAG: hypothetical protein HYW51_01335 [Candidatus Doudnabacteria bacterium]|nr:hypothetical protein [Candidatus Doudnabacteria bacterium]